ncbi:MAG: MFS transporter, partial [Saprospiraceae bacterium]|nr:MFS transporter [Saprospiraceae bacterium]
MQRRLNDPKVINAWALFDWANSAFALVITVAIFPAYFAAVTDDTIHMLGMDISNSSLYAFAISASYLTIAAFSPLLSGIADYGGRKKFFLQFFTVLGSLSCLSLFFFKSMDQLAIGTLGFILAMIGFAGGLVFYNSYLPEITTEDRYDRVSARGFSFGYIGSVLLLISNLIIISNYEWLGLPSEGFATRLAFVMVGLWWIGFALIPFYYLPPDPDGKPTTRLLSKGMEELKKVWRAAQYQPNVKRFLIAFFCYSAGVQTVLFLAATFAEKELQFDTSQLIIVILILQIIAIGGAYLFARISDWRGNKFSLISMLLIWTAICLFAYFVQTSLQFYFVAGFVGLVMGGIQSLSRSTYSKLIPPKTKDTTSYFSFYDVLEKVAIVVGTFGFGFIDQLTGSMR